MIPRTRSEEWGKKTRYGERNKILHFLETYVKLNEYLVAQKFRNMYLSVTIRMF
jgi:hypothetical protein